MNDRSGAYSRQKHILFFIGIAENLVFLALFLFLLSGVTKKLAFAYSSNFYVTLTIYLTVFSVTAYLFGFPTYFYRSFILEHVFSLSNQTYADWVRDEIKRNMLGFPVYLGLVFAFYFVLINTGAFWWLWLGMIYIVFTLFFTRIMPIFIIPLFYKYSAVDNIDLKTGILNLANRSGIRLIDVFKIDFSKKTKKANAAVVGIGGSRRVILADTLIGNFTESEILSVCAHEFGHHKLKHMPRLIMFSIASTIFGFFVLGLLIKSISHAFSAGSIHDISIFPAFLFVLSIYGLLVMPLQNAYSRCLEKAADKFAIDVTGDNASFISAMNKLASQNLSEKNPPKLIKYLCYTHPTIAERVAFAYDYKPGK